MVGARPLLIDVDPATYNMDPDDLRKRLRARTKAIILPHMFGLAAEVEDIVGHGIPVIEDCAMSLGAQRRGTPAGGVGTLAVVSFYATKMIAAGEGGMVLGNRKALLREARDLRSYDGHRRHRSRFNYKMTELQAAMGRAQLARLPNFIRRRRALASRYQRALAGGPWELPTSALHHIYYRFVIQVHGRARRFLSRLDDLGVEARRPVFKPLHRYLERNGFPGTD
jgi:dTDP-4-amino-4,6-dideoxygalactose transaminase